MNDEQMDHSPDGLVSATPLKITAKEGAGVPVAPSGEPRMQRTISRLQKQIIDLKASRDHFQRLATPPAVMPAAPSDAVKDKQPKRRMPRLPMPAMYVGDTDYFTAEQMRAYRSAK